MKVKVAGQNLSTSVAATINFSYDKKLIAAAIEKAPYSDNSASKIIVLQWMNMLDILIAEINLERQQN